VLSGVFHQSIVVCHESSESGIDFCDWIKRAEVALREWPAAIAALRTPQKEAEIVFAASDLVEKVDLVHMRAPVDVIMLWAWPNRPNSVIRLWCRH